MINFVRETEITTDFKRVILLIKGIYDWSRWPPHRTKLDSTQWRGSPHRIYSQCIEAVANAEGRDYVTMLKRMENVDMTQGYILECYDALHTQSWDDVLSDLIKLLYNRESCMISWLFIMVAPKRSPRLKSMQEDQILILAQAFIFEICGRGWCFRWQSNVDVS